MASQARALASNIETAMDDAFNQVLADGIGKYDDMFRQLNARLTGQWSPDPLISNEGFSLGGMSTIRGYYESEAIGDYGFAYQTELRSPDLAGMLGDPINELRFHAFIDSGYVGIHHPLESQIATRDTWLSSVGLGGRIKLFDYLNGALDVGTPLKSGPESNSGDIFVRFRVQGEF